tara:strand:+ start:917 stop:2119 length:1203 start_codon:yes stop_codon:yes gene_type:complete
MKSFLEYLNEDANVHLTHLEDLVLEGSNRVQEAIYFLEEMQSMLSGNVSSKINATVKWDGAPAIICGINPENNKFFVGTKSVFNKKPKINYTLADIRKNHKGGVVSKLQVALKHLPSLGMKGIYQGDMMFGPGDTKSQKIDGDDLITFTPNTITYAVDMNSDEGKKIKSAKMGIVFHTKYSGRKIKSLKASFGVNAKRFRKSRNVWFDDASFRDVSGNASLSSTESSNFSGIIKKIKSDFNKSKVFIDSLSTEKTMVEHLNIFINSQVRKGSTLLSVEDFTNFVDTKMQKGVDSLKTEAGKKKKELVKNNVMDSIKSKNKELNSVFSLHASLSDAKLFLLRKLESIKAMKSFIQTGSGFKVTKPEGFVAIDKLSNKAVKFVDRLEFSRANFSVPKDWIKG